MQYIRSVSLSAIWAGDEANPYAILAKSKTPDKRTHCEVPSTLVAILIILQQCEACNSSDAGAIFVT